MLKGQFRRLIMVSGIVTGMFGVAIVSTAPSSGAATSHTAVTSKAAVGVAETNFDSTNIAKFKLSARGILGGLKAELKVPNSWVTNADQEGKVYVTADGTPAQFGPIVQAFEERYPGITVNYTYASATAARVTAPLVAFQQGKFTTDVITGVTSEIGQYNEYHVISSLKSLPMWNRVPALDRAREGNWIGYGTKFWGIGYNTNLISKSQLPKTWEGVLTDPAFANGKLAIVNRPNLFLEELVGTYGLGWANRFQTALFHTLKPSLDAGSIGATPQLVANGTYSAVLPMASYLAEGAAQSGAPVSWYTPLPPIANVSDAEVMTNCQHCYAAKIFVNWLSSEEGEFADWVGQEVTPILPQMLKGNLSRFIPFASQVSTHKKAVMAPGQLQYLQTKIGNSFSALWNAA